jgi:TPP-dependent pyruvate/acetoin dehydrogenase alpha subunit
MKNAELTRQQHLDLYYYMRLNRAVEDTMVKLFRQNKIVGGLYSSLGQEAISVGTAFALEKKDWLAPMIRNIGALLVKGVPPRDGHSRRGKYSNEVTRYAFRYRPGRVSFPHAVRGGGHQ